MPASDFRGKYFETCRYLGWCRIRSSALCKSCSSQIALQVRSNGDAKYDQSLIVVADATVLMFEHGCTQRGQQRIGGVRTFSDEVAQALDAERDSCRVSCFDDTVGVEHEQVARLDDEMRIRPLVITQNPEWYLLAGIAFDYRICVPVQQRRMPS